MRDELPPLKLEKARFTVQLDKLDEARWGDLGWDQVSFVVTTNPGAAPGPIEQVASGGELARFMLALTVVLAGGQAAETLIFDEVDSGIGGATAAAVGERLKRLSEHFQMLVITHSPQVAAMADQHWRVAKETFRNNAITTVAALDKKQRREEIARMLAGATITDEARAAADKLLAGEMSAAQQHPLPLAGKDAEAASALIEPADAARLSTQLHRSFPAGRGLQMASLESHARSESGKIAQRKQIKSAGEN